MAPSKTPKTKKAVADSLIQAALNKPSDGQTEGFYLQQVMVRVKDPVASVAFYSNVLGMRLLKRLDFPAMTFSLFFMGYCDPADIPEGDGSDRMLFCLKQKAALELTHNWGTESSPDPVYHNGNTDPRGFGHIGVCVPDVYAACERFERLGAEFVKKPLQGSMTGIAFIKDPDGYWIEIFDTKGCCEAIDKGLKMGEQASSSS